MANELLSVLSGFMQGYAGAKNAKREKDEKKIMSGLQQQKLKLDLENAKRQNKFLDLLAQQMQVTQTATGQPSTGPAEAKKPDILDILAKYTPQSSEAKLPQARGQGGFEDLMSDPKFQVMSKLAGQDLSGVGRLIQQTRGQDTARDRLQVSKDSLAQRVSAESRSDVDRDAARLITQQATNQRDVQFIKEPDPDNPGAERYMRVSLTNSFPPEPISSFGFNGRPNTGAPPAITRPNLRASLTKSETPIAPEDRAFWIDPRSFAPVSNDIKTAGDAAKIGAIRVNPTQMTNVGRMASAKEILVDITELFEKVLPEEGSELPLRIGGAIRKGKSAFQAGQVGRDAAVLEAQINGNKATFAKALGEVGNLSENEQQAVISLFGSILDDPRVARAKLNLLRKQFDRVARRIFPTSSDMPILDRSVGVESEILIMSADARADELIRKTLQGK